MICAICSKEFSVITSEKHPELCVECVDRADKFMYAAYVLTKGQPGVYASLPDIYEFIKGKH